MPIGIIAVRAIVFPYSFWASENLIIGSNSIQYGFSFAALAEKCMVLIQHKLVDRAPGQKYSASAYITSKLNEYKLTPETHSNYDLNEKIKSFSNLIHFYLETNAVVVK